MTPPGTVPALFSEAPAMITVTTPVRIAAVLALVTAAGLAGCAAAGDSAAGDAAPARTAQPCEPPDRPAEWPSELTVGTRLLSEVHTSYLVQSDCGVLTLIRSDDPHSCYYLTAYGLQRYPC
jgi:hypothetical protein